MAPPSRSTNRSGFGLALVATLLVVMGLGAKAAVARAWDAFTKYQSPFAFHAAAEVGPRPKVRLAERAVVVLVDGLSLDATHQMPFLNELRHEGADVESRVGQPSLSLPGRGVLYTGAWQELHGQMTNFNPRPLAVDSLYRVAKRAGLRTALAAGKEPGVLLAPDVDEAVVYPPSGPTSMEGVTAELHQMGAQSRALIDRAAPGLVFIDYTIMDQLGHAYGEASEQYRQGTRLVDDELRALASRLDLGRTVLIVTSDHGHTPTGGHGGAEETVMWTPMVWAGPKIRAGAHLTANQVDLAPTLAATLGLELPSSSQGRVLFDALEVDEAWRADVSAVWRAQQEAFTRRYLRAVAGEAAIGADARERRKAKERTERAPYALAIVLTPLLFAAALGWRREVSKQELFAAAVFGLLALAVYAIAFRLLGLGYSFSAVNKDTHLNPFFYKDMAAAVGACCAVTFGWALWASRRAAELPWSALVRQALWTQLFVAWAFAVKAAVVYAYFGVFISWYLPDLFWGFGFYLDVLALMALGFTPFASPLFAFCGDRLGRRLRGSR